MRNYELLPDSTGGSDLDILISPKDKTLFREVLYRSIERADGVSIGCTSKHRFFIVCAFGCNPDVHNSWWGVSIDVHVGCYSYKGSNPIELDHYFMFQKMHNGIKVFEVGFTAILGVLKEVLNNDLLPERYRQDAARAVQYDWQRISSALAPLGKRGLDFFRQIILTENEQLDIKRQSRALRRAFLVQAFRKSPFKFLSNRFLYEWKNKVRRYLRPSGIVVAVLGVDGVGKSTVINSIRPVLEEATHGALSIRHLRPGLLPPLARLKGKQPEQIEPVTNPHGSTPSGVVGSLCRLIYLTFDYIFGYWVKIRPLIAKKPTVVLFDRYAYDMSRDPRRFRLGINRRVIEWFLHLVPKPDLVLCMYAEPEVIALRKQELSIVEITRQLKALRDLVQKEPRAILVSTEGTVEEVRDRVLTILMDYCKRRGDNG